MYVYVSVLSPLPLPQRSSRGRLLKPAINTLPSSSSLHYQYDMVGNLLGFSASSPIDLTSQPDPPVGSKGMWGGGGGRGW